MADNNKNTKSATMMPTMCYTCGSFCYLREFIKMIIEKILEFVGWCFGPMTWGLTACCGVTAIGCPITFRKLL